MKPDEQALFSLLKARDEAANEARAQGLAVPAYTMARHIAADLGMHQKRANYIFKKWAASGWYNYGTVIDGGWLTAQGLSEGISALSPRPQGQIEGQIQK